MPQSPIPIIITTDDGHLTFPTIQDLAQHVGCLPTAIKSAVRRGRSSGKSRDEILSTWYARRARGQVGQSISITINGIEYPTIRAACNALGYNLNTLNAYARKQQKPTGDLLKEWVKTKHIIHGVMWSKDADALIQKYYPVFGAAYVLQEKCNQSCKNIQEKARRLHVSVRPQKIHLFQFAYKANGVLYYWFYCRTNNALMLLTPDEILNYLENPTMTFVQSHMVPPFVIPPKGLTWRIIGYHVDYKPWSYIQHRQEVTPTDV